MKRPKILVIQGANMNWLGKREPEKYGTITAAEVDAMMRDHAAKHAYDLEIFYTNSEGACLDRIYEGVQQGVGALVMNPGGFTYAGRAVADCIRGTRIWVSLILDLLATGSTAEEILAEFPGLTGDDIHACLAYGAEAARGRFFDVALDPAA